MDASSISISLVRVTAIAGTGERQLWLEAETAPLRLETDGTAINLEGVE